MYNSKEFLYNSALQWIQNMLLYDEIRLKDIPFEIRSSDRGIYITALRISNKLSCNRYIRDLNILCNDILVLGKSYPYHSCLIDVLNTYLSINDHLG